MRRYHLQLTPAEIQVVRSTLSSNLDSGELSWIDGDRAGRSVIGKIDAAQQAGATVDLTRSEASAVLKAAENSLNDPDFRRDYFDGRERHGAESALEKLSQFVYGGTK